MRKVSPLFPGVASLFLAGVSPLLASPEQPKPGPEQERLIRLAGTWKFRLEMKPSPFGPRGTVTGTDHNEILPGGFFLVRRYVTKTPVGEIKGLEVIGYDAEARAYLQRGFNSFGEAHTYTGSVDGDTWDWRHETRVGTRAYKFGSP